MFTRSWTRACGKVLNIMTRICRITCRRFYFRRIFTNWGFWMICTGPWGIIVTRKGLCYWVTRPVCSTCWLLGMTPLSCSRKRETSTSISWLTSSRIPPPCNGEISCHLSWTPFPKGGGLWSWAMWSRAFIAGVTETGVYWQKEWSGIWQHLARITWFSSIIGEVARRWWNSKTVSLSWPRGS